jgi:ATP-dependent Clp protease ATP-binding subunit ClpA
MKRVFQRDIQNPLAVEILAGNYPPGSRVQVEVEKGEFAFHPAPGAQHQSAV